MLWISYNMLVENHLIEVMIVIWDMKMMGRQLLWKNETLNLIILLTPEFSVPSIPQVFCTFLINHIDERVEVASPH